MKLLFRPKVLVVLAALSLAGCATPGRGPDHGEASASIPTTGPERLSDAVVALPTELDSAPADPTLEAPAPAPPAPVQPLPDDKRKLIEEYKALALKNDCSKGYPRLPGTWRFVGETKTPNYSDTIVIDGTRFKETISGNPDGRYLSAELEGEIRCVFKNRVLVQIDRVAPEGAYGNRSGDSYPCDLLSDMDPKVDRMLMICYFDWDLRTAAGLEFEFERVEKP